MKYDTIRITASLNAPPGDSKAQVVYGLLINDQKFHPEFVLNIFDLAKSCQSGGELSIFVCSCGEPSCAGIFEGVMVDHLLDTIVWGCTGALSAKGIVRSRADFPDFFFEPQQYIRAIEAGIKDIKQLAISAERPVEFPVHGVQLEDVMMLQARVFSTNPRDGETRLSAQQIIVNGYSGLITVDGVNYSVSDLYLPDELVTKYAEWRAQSVFPNQQLEVPMYLAYLQSGRAFCQALRRYLGQQTVVKFSYHPPAIYNDMAWEVTETIR